MGIAESSRTLVPRDDTTTLDMLAHCETFRRPSLSCQPGSTQLNHVFSYGIAGVFTPQDKRGHGYARQLLRLLHYVMAPTSKLPPFPATWGPPPSIKGFGDASFSVLYSGVGDKYYASCKRGDGETSLLGWERQHVTSRHWTVPQEPMEGEADVQGDWIGSDGLQALENIATETMTRELGKSSSEEYRVAILPNEWVRHSNQILTLLGHCSVSTPFDSTCHLHAKAQAHEHMGWCWRTRLPEVGHSSSTFSQNPTKPAPSWRCCMSSIHFHLKPSWQPRARRGVGASRCGAIGVAGTNITLVSRRTRRCRVWCRTTIPQTRHTGNGSKSESSSWLRAEPTQLHMVLVDR